MDPQLMQALLTLGANAVAGGISLAMKLFGAMSAGDVEAVKELAKVLDPGDAILASAHALMVRKRQEADEKFGPALTPAEVLSRLAPVLSQLNTSHVEEIHGALGVAPPSAE